MKFYTDGSRIGLQAGQSFIGWSAVCSRGVIVAEGRYGGSNINAEILADSNVSILKVASH